MKRNNCPDLIKYWILYQLFSSLNMEVIVIYWYLWREYTDYEIYAFMRIIYELWNIKYMGRLNKLRIVEKYEENIRILDHRNIWKIIGFWRKNIKIICRLRKI
jgi:hypothetical protein